MNNQTLETLKVDEVVMRQKNDKTGEFPAVVLFGISVNTSESGNSSISKRRISLPVNGLSFEEAKEMFPKGMILEGLRIEPYKVEPYEWITPEGEVRVDDVRYRLVKTQEASKEPVTTHTMQSQSRPSLEKEVFATNEQ